MRKLALALMLALLVVVLLAGPTLAAGVPVDTPPHGVSATGLGRCGGPGMEDMGPGTGKIVAVWVPSQAGEHLVGNPDIYYMYVAP